MSGESRDSSLSDVTTKMTVQHQTTQEGSGDSTTIGGASHPSTASDDATPAVSLDRRFLYQNPSTGAVSSTSLTVKQLCRMFSPPSSSDSSSSSAAAAVPTPSRFNLETQLLALLDDHGQTYDPEGWRCAKEIPVIKHAACPAFYFTSSSDASTKSSQGPVSCRQLSNSTLDPEKDQVYSESTSNQWTPIKALPDLLIALEAFRDQPIPTDSQDAKEQPKPVDYDVSVMVYDDDSDNQINVGDDNDGTTTTTDPKSQKLEEQVQDELEAFLSSTDHLGPKGFGIQQGGGNNGDNDQSDDEGYESDGGTKYVKDPRTGNWIHQALAPPRKSSSKPSRGDTTNQPPTKKAKTQQHPNKNNNNNGNKSNATRKKAKFKAKNAKCWIYITGLPPDTNEDEVATFFSKVGIIDLDPETQRPKVKVYRHREDTTDEKTGAVIIPAGTCKGDASIGYARPESVELALQVLDEAPFRDDKNPYRVHVERAKFEQHGDYKQQKDKKKRISQAQRKVAKLAAKQAIDWDDGEFNGRLTGGVKGLRIIVLKRMFHPNELSSGESSGSNSEQEEDALLAKLEQEVRQRSEEYGAVEKITVFSKNPRGIVVVKFTQPGAASEAIKAWNGSTFALLKQERKVEASFWDGVEDFTVRNEEMEQKEMEKRHDAFGAWLESQAVAELPEELRLKVED